MPGNAAIFSTTNNSNYKRYVEYAAAIITSYEGNEPLHFFLKKYYSLNRKHGSRDRKCISAFCYYYYRVGFGVIIPKDLKEKILLAAYLCEPTFSAALSLYNQGVHSSKTLSLKDKIKIVEKEFDVNEIFPYKDELSEEINVETFNLSFLIQPKVFIRIRPGFTKIVTTKVKNAGVSFEEFENDCLAFSNNEKIGSIIEPDNQAVIQDYNSQKTLSLLKKTLISKSKFSIWDCCTGSGGKSILAYDTFKNIVLTVSDKRKSILENLRQRFSHAGIRYYTSIVADLQNGSPGINNPFDVIIADVPCTGSGTWARTPEQLTFFKPEDIEKYTALQRKIIKNSLPFLKEDGHLLYITCSVFKKENEENVAFIQQTFHLSLLAMEYLKGYEMQADTLFVALLKRA